VDSSSMDLNVCNKASKSVLLDTNIMDWHAFKLLLPFVPMGMFKQEAIVFLNS